MYMCLVMSSVLQPPFIGRLVLACLFFLGSNSRLLWLIVPSLLTAMPTSMLMLNAGMSLQVGHGTIVA